MSDSRQHKDICIFGLGQSGVSAARYLQRMNKYFFVVDSRENPPDESQLEGLSNCRDTFFGEIPKQKLLDALMIIVSPGISPDLPELALAKAAGVNIIGDIEIFVNHSSKKIVAITGSNGKSTVTDLTCRLMCATGIDAKIGGNFGVPALDYLPEDTADIYVLEISSFQLDTTHSLKADIAVLLNISEDHMERYHSLNEYRDSKLKVFQGAKRGLANADDELTLLNNPDQQLSLFSVKDETAKYHLKSSGNRTWLVVDKKPIVTTDELRMSGTHNWCNALVSLAILNELNIEMSTSILDALKQYEGLPHRFQLVCRSDGVDWVNDSKATNVGATLAALNSIDENRYSQVILIAGGDAKGNDLSPLKEILQTKVTFLILIGKDSKLFERMLNANDATNVNRMIFAVDMNDAVTKAKELINRTDCKHVNVENTKAIVLLSPACASLDMYKNFEARGNAFVNAVKECA